MTASPRSAPDVVERGASTCPACGEGRTSPRYAVNGHAYVECVGCGSARLDPMPPGDPADLYDDGYFTRHDDRGGYLDYEHDAPMHRVNGRRRIARIVRHLGEGAGGVAIDVGCASGYTLDAARAVGFRAVGVDVSAWARSRAAERGHPAHPSLGEAIDAIDVLPADPSARGLQVVSFFQSLEHMERPSDAVRVAAAALAPGGVLIVETWDRRSTVARLLGARWHQVNPPTVLHHFTRPGLRTMLETAGLDVVAVSATSKLVSPELIVGVVASKAPRLAATVLRGLRRSRLSGLPIPYRAGDLITVVAVSRRTVG